MSTIELYTGRLIERPAPAPQPYVYPPNDYAGPIRFDRIDDRILWAEAEDAKGEEHSHWYQGEWVADMADALNRTPDPECGTAFCLAGSAAYQAGWYAPLLEEEEDPFDVDENDVPQAQPKRFDYSNMLKVDDPGARARNVEDIANEYFGLTKGSARFHSLFAGRNNIGSLKRIRDELASDAGFPTRWTPPRTPTLDYIQDYQTAIEAERFSQTLDRLAAAGALIEDIDPDAVLAGLLGVDLDKAEAEQKALAAWNASH